MSCSLKHFYGLPLSASDGEIGHVKDFYFDDRNWAVRYVIVDTGSWLTGRQVLLSPHSFGLLQDFGKPLPVRLTRRQIENSPLIATHKPVSRQYEEDHYQHYGLPYYWAGIGLWGMSGFPIVDIPLKPGVSQIPFSDAPKPNSLASHLRSTKAVAGYHLKASGETIGHVADFIMDTRSWAILDLVIKIGNRFSGKEVRVPVSTVDRVSYEESSLFTTLAAAQVEQYPLHETSPVTSS